MSRRFGTVVLLTMTLGTVLSCGFGFEESDLYGEYVADFGFGKDVLLLRPDGTYDQRIEFTGDERVLTASGDWSYNSDDNFVAIYRCLSVVDSFGELRPDYDVPLDGFSLLPPERALWLWGRVRLGPDEGFPYRKKRSEDQ